MDQDALISAYREWRAEDVTLWFTNPEGEAVEMLSPKRGNRSYSYRHWKKMRVLEDGMQGMTWDYEVPKARRDVMRKTHLLFVTLTFARNLTRSQAWQRISSQGQALNRYSAAVYKVTGSKAMYKCKESQSDGYPAPHLVIVLDRPVTAFRHKDTWRVQQRETVKRLKAAWPYGYVDVQACVGGSVDGQPVMQYVTKYARKTTTVCSGSTDADIGELTHAWQKVYGLRDVVGKEFLNRLNLLHVFPEEEDTGPSGWELTHIEIRPDLVLVAKRLGWVVKPPPDGTAG